MSRRDLFRAALRASAAAAIASTVPGCGDESESGEDNLDGAVFGPRPFYVCGHNPNTIAEVKEALAQGANAVEPDINVYKDGSGRLCISHGEGDEDAPSLEQYLKDLHTVAVANPQLAFVIFDCKPGSVSPENGRAILAAIRKHLTYDLKISFVISVAMFESVRQMVSQAIDSKRQAEEGKQKLAEYLQKFPNLIGWDLCTLASVYSSHRQFKEAQRLFDACIKVSDKPAVSHLQAVVMVDMMLGDYAAMQRHIDEAEKLEPSAGRSLRNSYAIQMPVD